MKTKGKEVEQIMEKTTIADSQEEPEIARSSIGIDPQGEIRRRAYELYEQRGKEDGRDVDDWLQAESELIAVENNSNGLEQALMMGASLRQRALSHRIR
jgi:hypothetical protein